MALLIILQLIFFVLLATLLFKKSNKQHPKQAPGPQNLPVLGSLHHLLGRRPQHQILRRLSATYGPVMRLRLGEIDAVVISSADAAREIMKTHDVIFASRPITASIRVLCYGGRDIAFAPYGEFWRQMRRLCIVELFSARRIRSFRAVRVEEVAHLLRSVAAASESGVAVGLGGLFLELSSNIITRIAIGGKSADQKMFQAALAEIVELASGFTALDLFPSMPFIGRLTGIQRKLEKCQQKLEQLNEEIIEQHRKKREQNCSDGGMDFFDEDITDALLRIQQDGSLQIPLSDDHIKAVLSDLLTAGTETTATTMEWAMSELARHPAKMRKAQSEAREVLGSLNMISEEEVMSGSGLSYLNMVIKETLRLHPPLPLLLPRESRERCEVMGFEIPAKTTVMVNAWAVGRDPGSWDEPEAFRPERFEETRGLQPVVDFKGAHMEFIPFGAGRRICPGMQFGLATVETTLAHLLCYFDWEYPVEKGGHEELDMSEASGLAVRRKKPLSLLATPRIPLPPA